MRGDYQDSRLRQWIWGALVRLLPKSVRGAPYPTWSALKLGRMAWVALCGVVLFHVALWLLDETSWRDIVAGALLAWAVSLVAFAAAKYQGDRGRQEAELRRSAELDVVHARLNQIAAQVGARRVDLSWELADVTQARLERKAHLQGFEELSSYWASKAGYKWWDETATAYREPPVGDVP